MNNSKPPPSTEKPSFLRRISLAFSAFFSTLGNADYAARIERLRHKEEPVAPVVPEPPPIPPPAPVLKDTSPDAALQLLGLLQREGRLLDFTQENLKNFSDADIGAAARLVHEGCRKVLQEHFSIEPVRQESEGSRITLNEGFNAAAIRLTGNVAGKAPFQGSISHRGWRVTAVRLPQLVAGHDASVLAPAEVEL
jgi:hypothetical protein